ncbi:MAG: hypothetical protein K2P99_07265 [Burkholderiales bacterium]|nr:hypothetical protein [Burkholderiales bacterium]
MKKISLVVDKIFLNNKIFENDPILNFDNYLAYMRHLKLELAAIGYNLSTYDINKLEESELVFYFEINNEVKLPSSAEEINKAYLFIWECQIITPNIYDLTLHDYFNKIFTFRDDLVDNHRYFKINYSFDIPKKLDFNLKDTNKLCTLVAGHKRSHHHLELYSKRIEAIRWFELNAPNDFDLYGRGWDKYVSSNRVMRKLSKESRLLNYLFSKLLFKPYKSYKGELVNKVDKLKEYKFCICYENARDMPGYITEKIFHAFFAGCVPIYWGANNITDFIPSNCFIDKKQFRSYNELYHYIKEMSHIKYEEYLCNIERFLLGTQIEQFSIQCFSQLVIDQCIASIGKNE